MKKIIMKKIYLLLSLIAVFTFVVLSCDNTDDPIESSIQSKNDNVKVECATIPSGLLKDSKGETITTGYNDFGYNYQAHIYNGNYGYPNVHLVMAWNDAWLSNQDCDGDGLLDRPLDKDGNQYYFGSGAWLTNHWVETYTDEDGNDCVYDEFIKIVALPVDAYLENGYWYTADGVEIGESIWGQFAIIQYIVNDPCEGINGRQYISPDHPGLGNL